MDVHDYEGFECCEGREVDTGLAECEEPEVEDSQPAMLRLDAPAEGRHRRGPGRGAFPRRLRRFSDGLSDDHVY